MPRPTPASRVMPIDWSTRPSSSIATHSEVKSAPRAAVLLGHDQAEQAELAHRVHDLDREVVLAVPLRDVRRDLASRRSRARPCGRSRGPRTARTSSASRARCLTFTSTSSNYSRVPSRDGRAADLDGRRARRRARRHHPHAALLRGRGPDHARAASGTNRVYDQRDRARLRLILRGQRFGMTLAECREIVDMYDGAASSERRQLETLLGRLDEIAADLRAPPGRPAPHPDRGQRRRRAMPRAAGAVALTTRICSDLAGRVTCERAITRR